MLKRNICALLMTGFALFSTGTVMADEYHYTNLIIGDRASGMGGAYIAVSDDATGLYYNPAGTAYIMGQSFSASVNAYYNTEKKYNDVIAGNGWIRKSSSILPNFFGVVQPFGKVKVGISYAVPESMMEDQDQTFHDLPLNSAIAPYNPGTKISSYIINFNNESNTYNYGVSAATELTDKLSVGLTLYWYDSKNQWILNQIIKTTSGGSEWMNQYYQIEEWGIRPILGFMWSPVDKVSVGLAVSNIMIQGSNTKVQSSYRRENIAVDSNPSNNNAESLPDGISTFGEKRKYPVQTGLGVAWFASPSLLLSGDINHYSAVHYTLVQDFDFKEVTNFSLGAEYYLEKTWAMRAGFYTDFASTPKISSNNMNQPEHIDLYGGTLSISRFTRNTSVTLGGGYTYGTGKAQIISNSTKIQDVTSRGWSLFLSSSYSY
jgi:long-chain fatty acid transport protein